MLCACRVITLERTNTKITLETKCGGDGEKTALGRVQSFSAVHTTLGKQVSVITWLWDCLEKLPGCTTQPHLQRKCNVTFSVIHGPRRPCDLLKHSW
jgi:hypothetical protein